MTEKINALSNLLDAIGGMGADHLVLIVVLSAFAVVTFALYVVMRVVGSLTKGSKQ